MEILRTLNASLFLSTISQLSSKIGITVQHGPKIMLSGRFSDPAFVNVLHAFSFYSSALGQITSHHRNENDTRPQQDYMA